MIYYKRMSARKKKGHTLSVYKKGVYTPLEQQSRDGKQGAWTDVYALCATIYYCITGKTILEAVDRVMEDRLIAPSKLGVEISPAVEEILLRGLHLKPENVYGMFLSGFFISYV